MECGGPAAPSPAASRVPSETCRWPVRTCEMGPPNEHFRSTRLIYYHVSLCMHMSGGGGGGGGGVGVGVGVGWGGGVAPCSC